MRELVKAKVTLLGDAGVGKTSLVRRFVMDEFSDRYTPTIGAKVTKREVVVEVDGGEVQVVLTIWDIMGVPTFRELLRDAYFHNAQGHIAVCDLARPDTATALKEWIQSARDVTGAVPVAILGNKADLDRMPAAERTAEDLASALGVPFHHTSAKTGEHVEEAFQDLARAIVTEGLKAKRAEASDAS